MNNSWKRPKLRIPKTKSEWGWDILGFTWFIGSIILLFIVWDLLPEKVPGHYNALGEVDRWGSKWELIILPVLNLFLLVFMKILEERPELHNYPSRLNEHNVKEFYLMSRKLLNQLKNICLIVLSGILLESIGIAVEWFSGFGIWFLPVLLVFTILPIVMTLIKQRKIE